MNNPLNSTLSTMNKTSPEAQSPADIPEFSYDGYQEVRAEFFAHLFEPSVTLNKETVSVNMACLRKLPDTEYVQFLVNPIERKLAVKPCSEDMKDSFRWSSGAGEKSKPKKIACKIFFAKVMELMGWDPRYRYKILGKLMRNKGDTLFVFDLNSAEAYQNKGKNSSASRTPLYPDDWKNQFGIPASEHQDIQQISIFDDYTVFRIERAKEYPRKREEQNVDGNDKQTSNNSGSEEAADQDPQYNTSCT